MHKSIMTGTEIRAEAHYQLVEVCTAVSFLRGAVDALAESGGENSEALFGAAKMLELLRRQVQDITNLIEV